MDYHLIQVNISERRSYVWALTSSLIINRSVDWFGEVHTGRFYDFRSTYQVKITFNVDFSKSITTFKEVNKEIVSINLLYRPRKKAKISIEALFMIDFPAAKNKFTFYLDRKSKRVTIDINSNAQIFSKHLEAPALNETTTIRSLAFSFSGNSISLFLDCKEVYRDDMEFNLSKLFLNMDDPNVKLLRERKYPLFLDHNVEKALGRANCQKSSKQKGNRKMVKDSETYGYYNGRSFLTLKLHISLIQCPSRSRNE